MSRNSSLSGLQIVGNHKKLFRIIMKSSQTCTLIGTTVFLDVSKYCLNMATYYERQLLISIVRLVYAGIQSNISHLLSFLGIFRHVNPSFGHIWKTVVPVIVYCQKFSPEKYTREHKEQQTAENLLAVTRQIVVNYSVQSKMKDVL